MSDTPNHVALPFREGTWFAVPLRQGGFAVGCVARHTPKGELVLAYFFGPRRERVPTLDEVSRLQPEEAVKILRVSEVGLIDGSWPVIGHSPCWKREKWPIPAFIRREPLGGTAWRVVYSDDDPSQVVSEQRVASDTTGLEPNWYSGHVAAEIRLSKIL